MSCKKSERRGNILKYTRVCIAHLIFTDRNKQSRLKKLKSYLNILATKVTKYFVDEKFYVKFVLKTIIQNTLVQNILKISLTS